MGLIQASYNNPISRYSTALLSGGFAGYTLLFGINNDEVGLVLYATVGVAVVASLLSALSTRDQKLSWLLSALGAMLFIAAVAFNQIDPTTTLMPSVWWYIASVSVAASGLIGALTPLAVILSAFAISYYSYKLGFDVPTAQTLFLTAASSIAGITMAVSSGTPGKVKDRRSLTDRLDPNILLESIADGIVVVDGNTQIQIFNAAAEEITGWTAKDVKDLDVKSVMKLIKEDGTPLELDQNPFLKILRGVDTIRENNIRLATHSEKLIDVSLIVSPIKDSGEKVVAAVGIFRDITQEKHEQKQRAEFISTASHEMRTPVAAIEGYLALAMNDKVSKIDSKARDYLGKAHTSTQHLGKLFQDLLTAAKSEDGRLTNHPVAIEVGEFIDEMIEGIRFSAEKGGLLLVDATKGGDEHDTHKSIDAVRPLSYIHVDPERFREVITNLFDNAVKYTEEGKVTFGLETDEKEVIIRISDTGQGIPEEDIPHLFQKFYRVDSTATRQIGGTGLGLFISRKIIEMYNGRIWAESVAGEGSSFFVAVPRITPEQAQQLKAQEAAQSPLNRK